MFLWLYIPTVIGTDKKWNAIGETAKIVRQGGSRAASGSHVVKGYIIVITILLNENYKIVAGSPNTTSVFSIDTA